MHTRRADLSGRRVVLGVSGGIAAYKAATLLRLLTESGAQVTVVPTEAALQFVGAATWSALSGRPVTAAVWDEVHEVRHVALGQRSDLVVVAPATTDLLAKAAHGLADDLLTNVLLTARGQVLMAPAMHTEMWQHPATVANAAILRERGVHLIGPASGRLTGTDTGPGRMVEPEEIYAECVRLLTEGAPLHADANLSGPPASPAGPGLEPGAEMGDGGDDRLAGRWVVVTAGGTREALDPVRYLGNRSSGKMGYALAAEAARRGARVSLISANVTLPAPLGVEVIPVESALEMEAAVRRCTEPAEPVDRVCDVLIMAAAVADFRPAKPLAHKLKKSHAPGEEHDAPVIELVRNPDILAEAVRRRPAVEAGAPFIVGFAAETGDADGDVLDHARSKLRRKGCDLLVANEVGVGVTFGQDVSTAYLLTSDEQEPVRVGPVGKDVIAAAVLDRVCADVSGVSRIAASERG